MLDRRFALESQRLVEAVSDAGTQPVTVALFEVERLARALRVVGEGVAENRAGLSGRFLVGGEIGEDFAAVEQPADAAACRALILLAVLAVTVGGGVIGEKGVVGLVVAVRELDV